MNLWRVDQRVNEIPASSSARHGFLLPSLTIREDGAVEFACQVQVNYPELQDTFVFNLVTRTCRNSLSTGERGHVHYRFAI